MFITINEVTFVFLTDINFTSSDRMYFYIGKDIFSVNKESFKNFLEYSILLEGEDIDNEELLEIVFDYFNLINYSNNNSNIYYGLLIKTLIDMWLNSISDFNILIGKCKEYIQLLNDRNQYYYFLYFFINYFKTLLKENYIENEDEYYTIYDTIFDYYLY